MGRIVVGIDGSPGSLVALRWAGVVAARLGLPLLAVEAWQYPPSAGTPFGTSHLPGTWRTDQEIEARLRTLVDRELATVRDVEVTVQAGHGPATAALLAAAEQDTELLVVGSRGLGGFAGLLLGSVSRQLIEHAPCPVTVLPTPTDIGAPDTASDASDDEGTRAALGDPAATGVGDLPSAPRAILVGTDGSEHAERALRHAADLAIRLEADLTVATAVAAAKVAHDLSAVLDSRTAELERWIEPLREDGLDPTLSVVVGDARTALLEDAHDRGTDLLVIGSRGLGPVAKLLAGSVATGLVAHGDLPITVVPSRR